MRFSFRIILILILGLPCTGIYCQAKKPMHVFELSQAITEDLVKNYPGCLVRAAWKTDTSNFVSYEIRLIKAKMEYALIYNKDGKFLRRQAVSPVVAELKPAVHRRAQKSFFMQQLDSLQVSDSLILRY